MPTFTITDTADGIKYSATFEDDGDGNPMNIKVAVSRETLDALAERDDIIDLCKHHVEVGSHDYTVVAKKYGSATVFEPVFCGDHRADIFR